MSRPDVSVVVPVFRGVGTLPALVGRIGEAAARHGWRHEVLLVCDAPADGSWAVARRLAAPGTAVRAWLLRDRVGQHAATLLGIREARGRTILTMDEDLQHAPEDLPALVSAAGAGRVAYGVTDRPANGLLRGGAARFAKGALRAALGVGPPPGCGAFRAFDAALRERFAAAPGHPVVVDALLTRAGAEAVLVPCRPGERPVRRSGYSPWTLWRHLAALLLAFAALRGGASGAIVRLGPAAGAAASALALATSPPLWVALPALLLCLALLAEQARALGRRSPYVVRETAGGSDEQA